MRRIALAVLLFLVGSFAFAQQAYPPDGGPYRSGQFALLPQNAVPMIAFATANPTTATGTTQYFYWIVTNDVTNSRSSIPAGPFFTSIGPAALSATSSIKVAWTPYTLPVTYGQNSPNASPFTAAVFTYDVLETATGTPPSGTCTCAVATGIGGGTATDTGSYSIYTVSPTAWPGSYPAPGDLATFGPKGSVIDGGPAPTPPASPDVVPLTTTFQDAQNLLPGTGGASGIGGGVIDARNCTQLSPTALDFGTFTQTKPLTILLGPCVFTATQILVSDPSGNIIPFHMTGCGLACSFLVGNSGTSLPLIGQANTPPNMTTWDFLLQDFAIQPSGDPNQDVINISPGVNPSNNSVTGIVIQRLFISPATGWVINLNGTNLSNGNAGNDGTKVLIDDNRLDIADGAPGWIKLVGAFTNSTRITQNVMLTVSPTTPHGTGVSLQSASATSFPDGVVIESNVFYDNPLVSVELDGAQGAVIHANVMQAGNANARGGVQMAVGTGTVHSSASITGNKFNVSGSVSYLLKTTDASATATFTNNTIVGTPAAIFTGFTNNLRARGNVGGGLDIAQWEPTLFANLGTPPNGSFRQCSDCALTNPCTGGGTGIMAQRQNGAWNCAPVPASFTGTFGGTPITKFQILNDNTTLTCAGDQNVCTETLTWPVSMGDTSYTLQCTAHNPSNTTGAQGLNMSGVTIVSATQFSVSVVSSGSASKSFGGMYCWGWHQ